MKLIDNLPIASENHMIVIEILAALSFLLILLIIDHLSYDHSSLVHTIMTLELDVPPDTVSSNGIGAGVVQFFCPGLKFRVS
jgi:hypothetical protein